MHCRCLQRVMSWNDSDPAVDLEETLEAALEAGGVAAESAVDAAAATPAAVSAADEEGPHGEAPMAVADAEGPHGGGEASPSVPGPTDDLDLCAICRAPLSEDPDDGLAGSGQEGVQIAILPCMHKFHQCCVDETCRVLERPVHTLACPTCRRTPQDIHDMEERVMHEGLARRAAEGLPHRARVAQAARAARQLQIDAMFSSPAQAHGQRCAGLDNPWHPLPPPTPRATGAPWGRRRY